MKLGGKAKKFLAWISLTAFLIMGFANFQGMVLCFEPDGRVSLENAVDGICSDAFKAVASHSSTSVTSKGATIQAFHCKQCVDVPISMESSEQQDQKIQTYPGPIQMPMLAGVPSVPTSYLATVTEPQMPQPPPLRPAIHQFLRTIILLI